MGWVLCMSIESEATLEDKLMSKLVDEGYEKITIVNEKDLINNLKVQLEKFNKTTFTDEEFNKILLYLEGGSVFDKAKKLRDKFPLERKEGTKYVSFFNSEEWCKNIFPNLAKSIHIKWQIIHFIFINCYWRICKSIKFSKIIYIFPNFIITRMKNMCSVFMNINSFYIFSINITTDIISFINNKNFISFLR